MDDEVYKQIFEEKLWSFEFKLNMACRLAKVICDGHIREVTENLRWEITKQLQSLKLENRLNRNKLLNNENIEWPPLHPICIRGGDNSWIYKSRVKSFQK